MGREHSYSVRVPLSQFRKRMEKPCLALRVTNRGGFKFTDETLEPG